MSNGFALFATVVRRAPAVALVCLAVFSPCAFAGSGLWQRAWGKDVVNGGGTGFEVCTVAANCKHGAPGSLGGEMMNPQDVAVDGAGNVYAVDATNLRVDKFDSQGNWQRAWGTDVVNGGGTGFEICTVASNCKQGGAGSGLGGEMFIPEGIATDSAGNVYVADTFENRIEQFDSQGNFLRAWGKDVVNGGGTGFEVCTVAANCKTGASGGGSGEMNTPEGIATDGSDKVYVADSGNERIDEFDSQGDFLRAWGRGVDSGGGSGFDACLVGNCQAGTTGTLGGEMNDPAGVGADAAGNVYVAEVTNNRIQKFDSQGNWQRAWGKDVVTGGGTGFEICTVATDCKAGMSGALGGELNGPQRVAPDAAGSVYVTGNERVDKFDSQGNWQRSWGQDVVSGGGTGFEICTVAANCKVGTNGGLGGQFDGPNGIATDAARNVYAVDQNNLRIQKFTDPILTVQKAGSGSGTVTSAPAGIVCGAICSSAFDDGSVVTLTAGPAPGSSFAGWSGGGCAGTGACQVPLTTDTAVTATFNLNPAPPANPGQILERLALSHRTFRARASGGPVAARKKAPLGTTVSYALTEPADVKFTVQKRVKGHRKGRKCASGKPKRRTGRKTPRSCTLFKAAGRFSRQSQAGADHFKFTGRVAGRRLKPGRYRLAGAATDASGNRSRTLTANFTIVK